MLYKRLGIDLGTANSLVYLSGEGIVLEEPSVVAVSLEDNKVLAVGREARQMLGRTPENIVASHPMRNGVIADYVVTEAMLRYFIHKVCGRAFLFKPEVMICVPAGSTQVEQRAVEDATISAGARTVYIIQEPLAAAIGAGIPVAEPSGNMIVDIGGGTTEAAVISLGGVVATRSVRVAGNSIDDATASFIKRKHGLVIGEVMAENIKIKIGSAVRVKEKDNKKMRVKGRDSISGLPREIMFSTNEVVEAIKNPLIQIVRAVKGVLEEIPPELSSDIIDKGIIMSGGTAQLRNLDRLLTKATGVSSMAAEDAMLCVVKGTGTVLENIDSYKRSIKKR